MKTKIGGKPELPSDFEWYYYEGEDFSGVKKSRPLSFMAQINCAEIKSFDKDDLLPDTGMLYFFYELETMEWGYSPEHSGSARVYYYDSDMTELSQREFPNDLDEEWIIPEKILNFQCFNDIPDLCEADEYFGLCNNKEYDDDEDDGRRRKNKASWLCGYDSGYDAVWMRVCGKRIQFGRRFAKGF